MPKKIVKNQHYIPEALLWHFTNEDQKLFEVILEQKRIYPTTPGSSMCEKYTYEYESFPTNTIEDYLAKIDGDVAPLVKNIIDSLDILKAKSLIFCL